ncbi:MAG: glutathione S-transferase family protein [Polyangiales bacterium]
MKTLSLEVPHTEEWELYHNSFSICSKKVRVCMEELGLPYRGHHVHLIETGRYESVSQEYLRVNPKGTVPMLVHHGQRVFESHVQIAYAARHVTGAREGLSPSNPSDEETEHAWVDRASIVGDRPVSPADTAARAGNCVAVLTVPLFATMVRYIPYREIAKGLLTHPNKERPLLFLTLRLFSVKRLHWLVPAMRVIRRARRDLERHLDALSAQLSSHGGSWICGSQFTLADVSWVVLLDRLVEADWDEYLWGNGRRPVVAAYWVRLRERPSVQRQIDATRCEITRAGMSDLKQAKRVHPSLKKALEGRERNEEPRATMASVGPRERESVTNGKGSENPTP